MAHDPIAREVTRAKITLLLAHPFFGTMATGLQVILTDAKEHAWCNTAATDGKRLYMNREFVKSLTFDELVFVVAHEVLHVVYDHLSRREGRDPEYYNMAADYVINHTLVKQKIGSMPPVGLFSDKYTDEMTSEAVYEDLVKNQVTIEIPLDQHLDGNGGAQGNDGDKSGKGATGKKITVRVTGDGDGPPNLTKEEIEEIRQEVLTRTIQAVEAAQASDDPGCIPLGVRRMIEELTEPKMDWRTLIDTHLRSQQRTDYTYRELSRVELGGGMIFPAEDYDTIAEADIVIDTSGSMHETMLRDILSEVKGIMQTFGQFKLRVCTFDTQVYGFKEFNEMNIDEIDTYELQGGGGTDFMAVWNHWREEGRVPERAVWFTDGYPCSEWGVEGYCDTLWVVFGGARVKAPFGLTCYYEEING